MPRNTLDTEQMAVDRHLLDAVVAHRRHLEATTVDGALRPSLCRVDVHGLSVNALVLTLPLSRRGRYLLDELEVALALELARVTVPGGIMMEERGVW